MSERMAAALEQVATDPDAERSFSFARGRQAGTPLYWDELISVVGGGDQTFHTVRSTVDEGGEAIGTWSSAAGGDVVRALARNLLAAKIWTLPSDPISPGQDAIEYAYTTSVGVGRLTVTADSPSVFQLASVDSEAREVANDLRERHTGAELTCLVDLERQSDETALATVSLRNDGDRPGVLPGPFAPGGPDHYLRLEIARAQAETPGVTSLGLEYAAVPVPALKALPEPWSDRFLYLGPRSTLVVPVRFPVPLRRAGSFCRAVLSTYTEARQVAGLPVLRGRVFSREIDGAEIP
jgi:hypothetical protein